jgi:hypothetical protein
MTNREAAEYFASLDPEGEAEIYFVNGDLGTIEEEPLMTQGELDTDLSKYEFYVGQTPDPKKPLIFQKW